MCIVIYRFLETLQSTAGIISLNGNISLNINQKAFTLSINELLVTSTPLSGYNLTFGNASGSVVIPQSAFIGLKTDHVRVVGSALHRPALFSGSQENISVFTNVLSISFLNTTVQELKEPIIITMEKLQVTE